MAGVLTAVLMRNVPGGGQEKIINYPEKIMKSGHTDPDSDRSDLVCSTAHKT